MSEELVCVIQTYRWQCMECKTCTVCQQPHHEDEMMFCDKCDRGYHTFCVGMDSIPTGEWMDTPSATMDGGQTDTRALNQKPKKVLSACFFAGYSLTTSSSSGLWVCEVCDKDFNTPKKKGGAKTPKKSKSAKK